MALECKELLHESLHREMKCACEGGSRNQEKTGMACCNYNFTFNWNVSILVGNDHWTCQEAVYSNKTPFIIISSIFEVNGKGVTL